ncbi:MAG: biotin--[acetyl-CoA-carboxylase] ligase [Chloroflexi bacterium]|nr:biotin--[acetyl-CoA-carboxylase] ligase [Chloroflexota bacterium]MCI0577169.1 biotin--[acetyl-CoA-carboxylase] ligase [Chloroflexota bacterium]MCI0649908.1 biotin--[acetyl-CoA-carboxylase] ligase [Chloroflexota bacterium]MCI0725678.1 biotin--[acetyl-CoA-carboxylase] ligase [Chloroflexota bacterium]
MSELLGRAAVEEVLSTHWLGRPVYYFPAVGSTNDVLGEMARAGAPAGTMVVADFQSQGKGRLNRRWEAPAGTSLLISLLFRPGWPAGQAAWLTMMAGLAAVEAVQAVAGLAAGLKWPNDLVVPAGEGWRKFGGLLLEGEFAGDRLESAILGLGLNANIPAGHLSPAAIRATSLLVELGRPVSRLKLLAAYLECLEFLYEAAGEGHSPHPAWNARLVTLGRPVQVSGPGFDRPLAGTAEATDEWGRLLVRDPAGVLHAVAAGDVTLRG